MCKSRRLYNYVYHGWIYTWTFCFYIRSLHSLPTTLCVCLLCMFIMFMGYSTWRRQLLHCQHCSGCAAVYGFLCTQNYVKSGDLIQLCGFRLSRCCVSTLVCRTCNDPASSTVMWESCREMGTPFFLQWIVGVGVPEASQCSATMLSTGTVWLVGPRRITGGWSEATVEGGGN